jgi:hypothetical protein
MKSLCAHKVFKRGSSHTEKLQPVVCRSQNFKIGLHCGGGHAVVRARAASQVN